MYSTLKTSILIETRIEGTQRQIDGWSRIYRQDRADRGEKSILMWNQDQLGQK